MMRSEHELAGLAFALIGSKPSLTAREKRIAKSAKPPSKALLKKTRAAIRAGGDPLGEAFCELRSPEKRRETGAVYTPFKIVDAMVDWGAVEVAPPVRVVDAGAGSGRFLMRAASRFPDAALVAVETDPLAALLLRANAAVLGFADRLAIKHIDYRRLTLAQANGPTLFIGNPPYVRHHDISDRWKTWFAETAKTYGFQASKLAGLHIHFFLKTRELARAGDYGTFITAAEWIDVNYGSVLRKLLADGLGGAALHVIDPKAQPFAETLATGAITCFRIGHRPDSLMIRAVDTLDRLAPLSQGRAVLWRDMAASAKWTTFLRKPSVRPAGMMELGELFRVHRGQVTGGNAVWVAGEHADGLPERFLLPAITRAQELFDAGDTLTSADHLKRVIDLPTDLAELNAAERRAVQRFLAWAKEQGADKSYIATHRRAWWSVGLRDPAPILCTYMARRPPQFVRNVVGARHINIAHGLYPRQELSTEALTLIVQALNRCASKDGGRTYAGGLVKFEPKELERLLIPRLETLYAADHAKKVEPQAARRRRRQGDHQLSQRAS